MNVVEKREQALAKKEAERKEAAQKIKESKAQKVAERAKAWQAQKDAEQEKLQQQQALDERRAKNIADKEQQRKDRAEQKANNKQPPEASSKYSKKDVTELKKIFDEYDGDGSGKVSLEEFSKALQKNKSKAGPQAGMASSLAQRQAQKGVSIADQSEAVFREMDADNDGDVTFEEMLKVYFPRASDKELETMMQWVAVKAPAPAPAKAELSSKALQTIKDLFKSYDKDKSGCISLEELKKAMANTGVEAEDIEKYFNEYDEDGNRSLSMNEFTKLMESTTSFDED